MATKEKRSTDTRTGAKRNNYGKLKIKIKAKRCFSGVRFPV